MNTILEAVAVVLLGAGALAMTLSVIGTLRFDNVYMRAHAAAKSVMLGMVLILCASIGSGDSAIMRRALLILIVLLITAPVSAYAIARVAGDEHDDDDAIESTP